VNQPVQNSEIGSARAWFIWSLAALAFGYAFFHRVAPSVMVSDLMAEFAIGAGVLGTLSALYFYPYVLMQIPLGVLIDRWGARKLLAIALSIATAGSFLFASSTTVEMAYIGRFLIGVGSAVGFLGSLAIAAKWFPKDRFAFLAGLTMFFAMMSGIFAQGPLAAFVNSFGWRNALWSLGSTGALLAVAILIFVRNSPQGADTHKQPKESWGVIGKALKQAGTDLDVWKVAIVASTMSGPMLTLGALWGTPYLMTAYGLDRTTAASLVSILLLAWAFGAPFSGWLSDRIRKRKMLLVGGSFILTCTMGLLVFLPGLPLSATIALLALSGLSGAAMAVCFALVREISPPQIGTSVTGIVNSMTVASGAVLQPAVGFMLDQLWSGTTTNGARAYLPTDFRTAFILIFIACLIGFLTSLTLKESPQWDA